jgi:transcriptional regulator with XRE-family HTH domain
MRFRLAIAMAKYVNKGALKLRAWRRDRDLAQAAARIALGLPADSIVSRLENGQRPSLELAIAIEQITGIPAGDWLIDVALNEDDPEAPGYQRKVKVGRKARRGHSRYGAVAQREAAAERADDDEDERDAAAAAAF